ncbi:MAG: dihydrofolate reductase [Bacteroidales bacterium]|nr:dihydrofolate reductase [Bacteroidales bacterium]
MKKKILITYQIPKEGLTKLYDNYEVTYPDKTILSTEDMLEIISEYDAIITVFGKKLDNKVIEKGTKLRIISNYGVGYDNIDINYAKEKGIIVTNTPNPVTEPTAEVAIGLMLSLMRRIGECNNRLRTEKDFKWGIMENLGRTLSGKTLGIIGMGKIGKSTAIKAKVFGMNIIYNNRNRLSSEIEHELGVKFVKFNELLETADVISIHTPLSNETHHMLSEQEFSIMKPSVFIINTARGAVIDEKILIKYLQEGKIAGAGLDVFENEPNIPSELKKMNNVVIIPHIGTGTVETRIEIAQVASKNIIDYFEGKTSEFVVNK